MKKIKSLVCTLMILIMTFSMSAVSFAAENTGITVNGRGVVLAEPDTATIYADVQTTASTSSEAQNKNNKLSEKIISSMILAGINQDKVVTEHTYVSPEYTYDSVTGKSRVTGYRAYANLSFATNDVDNAGKYMDAALKAGATGSSVSFSLESSAMYYAQALKEAVKTANLSAQAIAEACGVKLGSVKSVEESSTNTYTTYAQAESAAFDTAANEIMMAKRTETKINYDKISVSARVVITYNIQ